MIGFFMRLACLLFGHRGSWYAPIWHVHTRNNWKLIYITCARCNTLYLHKILNTEGEKMDSFPTFPNYVEPPTKSKDAP